MSKKDNYKPIRSKIEEWIRYDDHKPAGEYYDNVEAHDEYRRWHDRDCVLTGGCLEADTMFSLWLPLRHTIVRINDMEVIRQVGNIYRKYDFLRELIKGNNLQKLLPASMPITVKLSTLFALGMGRENVLILPDRQLNSLRGKKPYWDYVPAFLQASFPEAKFASYWGSPQEHLEWIRREHFQVFFDGGYRTGKYQGFKRFGGCQIFSGAGGRGWHGTYVGSLYPYSAGAKKIFYRRRTDCRGRNGCDVLQRQKNTKVQRPCGERGKEGIGADGGCDV